jgi:hypothetical protein
MEEELLANELASYFKKNMVTDGVSSAVEGGGGDVPHALNEAEALFDELYEAFPLETAKQASRKERDEKSYKSPTLVYGEISFMPVSGKVEQIG